MSIRIFRTIITVFFVVIALAFTAYRVHSLLTSDLTAPVITAESDTLEASVSITDEELLAGMTAKDNLDGDVTGSLVVASKSKFIKKGTLRVNYAAFDKSNNVGIFTRELTYTDYYSPRFSITQPLHFMSGDSRQNILSYISAADCLDGNITSQIMYTLGDKKMTSDTGSVQTMNLQVTNSAGDTSVLELQINYDDFESYYKQAPYLNNYVLYIKTGDKPDYRSLLGGIWAGGLTFPFSETNFKESDIVIDSSKVNAERPGSYPVVYRLYRISGDGAREMLGYARLTVIVEE